MSQQNHKKYRPDIDGLRAIAVCAVLAFHAFPSEFRGGFVGVDIFFVISGYLISRITFEELAVGTFTFADFYARRSKRIFPALILVMTVTALAGWVILVGEEMNQLGRHIAAGAGFVSNLVLWSETGYFDTASELKPLLHLWSLGIEEQFYIVWPILLWAALKVRIHLLILTLLIVAGSFFLNIATIAGDPTATFYSPLTRAWELLCGGILAWLSINGKMHRDDAAPWVAHALSLAGAGLLVASLLLLDKSQAFPGWWALVPVTGAMCLIAAGPQGVINRHILSTRLMVWLGLISFPLYLWHWPLLSFGRIVDGEQSQIGYRVFALLLSVLLAWLTYKFVEKPFRRDSEYTKPKVLALCSGLLLLGGFGLWAARADLRVSHTFDNRLVERATPAIGESQRWFSGKDDWLFLGDAHNRGVAKLLGLVQPTDADLRELRETLTKITDRAARFDIDVALLIAPGKSTIYPEYLPDGLEPASEKYIGPFLKEAEGVSGLVVHYPSSELAQAKALDNILYFRTDTHWNSKGAYLAFASLQDRLGLPAPEVTFMEGGLYQGDIINISRLEDFPLHKGDHWISIYAKQPVLTYIVNPNEPETPFGIAGTSYNDDPIIDELVWIVGDSFVSAMREYLNVTYREVVYVGHWDKKLERLPDLISDAAEKPGKVILLRAERAF